MIRSKGFTIVELLIVVVVIAILAGITIVAYNGISSQARQTTLISNLSSVGKLLTHDFTLSGSYPGSLADRGIASDENVTYSYHPESNAFCLTAQPASSDLQPFYVSNTNLTPVEGQCPQDAGFQVTTLAGSGTPGFANGNGTSAVLSFPSAITFDSSQNRLYFIDQATSRIRSVTTSGAVTTLAGNGSSGSTEGVGSSALFNWPQALVSGPAGLLYVADSNGNKIRVVPTNGTSSTSTLAGGTQGFLNGTGASARFNVPRGIAYDPNTNYAYVGDSQNHLIRRVSTTGVVTTLAGQTSIGGWIDATGSSARFNYPQSLAINTDGNIYVADTRNHRIRMVTPAGVVSTVAGSTEGHADGTGSAAQFNDPMGITLDGSGNIYVADTENNRIRKITPSGIVTTIAGSADAGFHDASGEDARFDAPKGIAYGDGKLYIADTGNNRIRVITLNP